MISFDDIPEIYIVKNDTDLRKGIDGYASIVQDLYQISPFFIVSFQIGSFNMGPILRLLCLSFL